MLSTLNELTAALCCTLQLADTESDTVTEPPFIAAEYLQKNCFLYYSATKSLSNNMPMPPPHWLATQSCLDCWICTFMQTIGPLMPCPPYTPNRLDLTSTRTLDCTMRIVKATMETTKHNDDDDADKDNNPRQSNCKFAQRHIQRSAARSAAQHILFVRSSVPPFLRSFLRSFVLPFVPPFVRSFVRSFDCCSVICPLFFFFSSSKHTKRRTATTERTFCT